MEFEKEEDLYDMYPIYTRAIRILVSESCPYSSEFKKLIELRELFEKECNFTNALRYYNALRRLYILYSATIAEKRNEYTEVEQGHGFAWYFPCGREVEILDLSFEYLCCMYSLLVYIIVRLTTETNMNDINDLIKIGIPIVDELTSLVGVVCPRRNFYLPLELKEVTVMSTVAIFITYCQISTFFSTFNNVELPESLNEDELRTISTDKFDVLTGIYQGVFITKNMASMGWRHVEKSRVGIFIDTLNSIQSRMCEMKQILVFLSFFNNKIFSVSRVKELKSLIYDVNSLVSSSNDVVLSEKMCTIYDILLAMKERSDTVTKSHLAIEKMSEGMSVSKNLTDYIKKNKVEPIVVL